MDKCAHLSPSPLFFLTFAVDLDAQCRVSNSCMPSLEQWNARAIIPSENTSFRSLPLILDESRWTQPFFDVTLMEKNDDRFLTVSHVSDRPLISFENVMLFGMRFDGSSPNATERESMIGFTLDKSLRLTSSLTR